MVHPTTQAFVDELAEGLRQPERWLPGHPLIARLERGELTRGQIAGLMGQVYRQTVEVVRWLGYLYARCPVMEVRREIFQNLVEEELGSYSKTEGHFHLAARTAAAAGADRGALDSVPLLPATRALIDYGDHVFSREPRWIVGFGAAFGFEYQSPPAFGRIAGALRKSYGMSSDDVAFFAVHVTADEDHTAGIVRVLDRYATAEEDRRAVRETAWRYAELYTGMLSTHEAFS